MRILRVALGCGIGVLGGRASLAQVVYVNGAAAPGGDGRSWATAFSDLQDGLHLADADPSVQEVWVAAGTYYPGPVGSPPSARFVVSRVEVYGGFVGNETAREQRRRDLSLTRLSGDLNRDGVSNLGDSWPTVQMSGGRLEGLSIVRAPLVPTGTTYGCGGIAFSGGVLRECLVSASGPTLGPAMSLSAPAGAIEDCSFDARSGFSQGLSVSGSFVRCGFVGVSQSGSVGVGGANVSLRNCSVSAGSDDGPALSFGTLICDDSSLSAVVGFGSGAPAAQFGQATIARCTLTASGPGGGIGGSAVLSWCRVTALGGSFSAAVPGHVVADNCTFTGAGHAYFQSGPTLRNCTVSGVNSASGPVIGLGSLRNCIVWGNTAQAAVGPAVSVMYSDVQGWAGPGEGNINVDPMLAPDGGLMAGSPCIDAGSNALAGSAPFDLMGACRVADGDGDEAFVVDVGAREFETCRANCDCSTGAPVLSVLDLSCFLSRFASGAAGNGADAWYANCDRSSVAPVLNVLDFNCFLNAFLAGCP